MLDGLSGDFLPLAIFLFPPGQTIKRRKLVQSLKPFPTPNPFPPDTQSSVLVTVSRFVAKPSAAEVETSLHGTRHLADTKAKKEFQPFGRHRPIRCQNAVTPPPIFEI